MAKSRLAWVALGLGAYIAFLITSFPASAALRWFAPAEVVIGQPSGTVWSGRIQTVSAPGFTLNDIVWTVDFMPLLLGRISGDFDARLPGGFVRAGFSIAWGGRADLEALQLSTNAQLSMVPEAFRAMLLVEDARGQITASIDELTLRDGWPVRAVGEVRIGNIEVAPLFQSGPRSMLAIGNYRALLADTGEPGVFAQLSDLEGPVELQGSLRLGPDRSYLIQSRLRARPGAPNAVIQGVELMAGEQDADGFRSMMLSGSL